MLAVGAGAGCSDIFLSRLPFLFSSPTLLDGWIDDVIKRLFQQNFSYIRTMGE